MRSAPIHHASSGSPTTGTPAAAAAATSGWSGRRPGPVTTSRVPAGRSSPATRHRAVGQVGQRSGVRVDDRHPRAQLDQRRRGGEPGDPGPGDEHRRVDQLGELHEAVSSTSGHLHEAMPDDAVSHSL